MKKIFYIIFIAGILSIGFIYANNCFRNFRCFNFEKNRNIYCENSKMNNRNQKKPIDKRFNNRDQERPRDSRGCPVNGRGQGKNQGECQNPDKGPGYGRGEGRGQGRYRSN